LLGSGDIQSGRHFFVTARKSCRSSSSVAFPTYQMRRRPASRLRFIASSFCRTTIDLSFGQSGTAPYVLAHKMHGELTLPHHLSRVALIVTAFGQIDGGFRRPRRKDKLLWRVSLRSAHRRLAQSVADDHFQAQGHPGRARLESCGHHTNRRKTRFWQDVREIFREGASLALSVIRIFYTAVYTEKAGSS
jgi:hypothetical protein